jgi:acetyl-CoA carboxylase carboxyl transferase subunit alpha
MDLAFEKPIKEIESKIKELKDLSKSAKVNFRSEVRQLEKRFQEQLEVIYRHISPWEILQIARHPERPVLQDYLTMIFSDFMELHGDRYFSDDQALIGGFAMLDNEKVMVIGHNKGKNLAENIERNFGSAKPDGYRKALRLMKLAEKFNIPVISFIDTAGAFPGIEAEERGQAEAIAHNLTEMARLQTPILVVVSGEGGSGGAIGIGVGDVVMMLSYSVYSVISPEGCASILWRDAKLAPEAAKALKITAPDLLRLGIIQEIIDEPAGGAHRNYQQTALNIKQALLKHIQELKNYPPKKLLKKRFETYAKIGNTNGLF